MTIDPLRDDLAARTHRGVAMPFAGILYWLGVAWLAGTFPLSKALVLSFFLTGAVFPLGLVGSWLIRADLFAKGHPLSGLGGTLNAVQLAYWPIVIVVFKFAPDWTMYTLAVLFASHFLPYGWLYRSAGYVALGLLGMVVPTAMALAGNTDAQAIALAMAAIYVVSTARVAWENRRDGIGRAAVASAA